MPERERQQAHAQVVSTAAIVIVVTPEEELARQADQEQHEIHVRREELRHGDRRPPGQAGRPRGEQRTEKTASGKDDGLKTCTNLPFLFQRISSLAANPTATSRNCR